jgi:hypothetical protein
MQRFVHAQNLTRFVTLLEAEADADRRVQLESLLIEEENRFGSQRERLDQAEALLAAGLIRLHRQETVVAGLRPDVPERPAAERLRDNMRQLVEIFRLHRDGLRAGLTFGQF